MNRNLTETDRKDRQKQLYKTKAGQKICLFADQSFHFCNLGRKVLLHPLTEEDTAGDRCFTEYNTRASLSPIGRCG